MLPVWQTPAAGEVDREDRKSTRLNSSHRTISYAVFCLKNKKISKFPGTGERLPTPDGAKFDRSPLNGPRAIDFDRAVRLFFFFWDGDHLDLHSFPTRRSSD